jgi:hypothetical protein
VAVAAALVSMGPAIVDCLDKDVQPDSKGAAAAAAGGAAGRGQGVWLYLSAYNRKTRRIEFLEDRVMDLYRFW